MTKKKTTKKTKKIDPFKRAELALGEIVAVLNDRSDAYAGNISRHLWNILSALRGPDAAISSQLKSRTTARIRGTLGLTSDGAFGGPAGALISMTLVEDLGSLEYTEAMKTAGSHFVIHYENAVKGLRYFGYPTKTEEKA